MRSTRSRAALLAAPAALLFACEAGDASPPPEVDAGIELEPSAEDAETPDAGAPARGDAPAEPEDRPAADVLEAGAGDASDPCEAYFEACGKLQEAGSLFDPESCGGSLPFQMEVPFAGCLVQLDQCGVTAADLESCMASAVADPCTAVFTAAECKKLMGAATCFEPRDCILPACLPSYVPRSWREAEPLAPISGGFTPIPALEEALLLASPESYEPFDPSDITSALSIDAGGDGLADLVLSRSSAASRLVLQPTPGTFVPAGKLPFGASACSFRADLDGDGEEDLFCGDVADDLDPAHPHVVFWGGAAFPDPGQASFLAAPGASSESRTSMSALPWDVDEDGLLDVVVSRFGAVALESRNEVFRNLGDRTFEETGGLWGLDVPGKTWCQAFFDLDGDGRQDVFVMNDGMPDPATKNRALLALGPGPGGEPRFEETIPIEPLCDDHGLFDVFSTPMGLAVGDLDGDLDLEAYAALTELDMVISKEPAGPWRNVRHLLDLEEPRTSEGFHQVRWSPLVWDFDLDGRLDLLVPGGDSATIFSPVPRGTSTLNLYRGRPDGRFDEIGAEVGLGAPGNFVAPERVDLDGDGDLDLLAGGFGQPVRAFRNEVAPQGNALRVTLRGTISNVHGLGALVRVRVLGDERIHPIGDHASPRLTGAPLLHVGLGPAKQADEVEVVWPSGHVDRLLGVPMGDLQLEEPKVVSIVPPLRRFPANGWTLVRIVARPRDPAGAPQDGADIEIESPFHAAKWLGPVGPALGGGAERTLVAPETPGSVVVEVSVDGVPYRVRPRIWFD